MCYINTREKCWINNIQEILSNCKYNKNNHKICENCRINKEKKLI